MGNVCRVIYTVTFLLLCTEAQAGESPRKIVLPNPQLIHCHAAGCSQLWKEEPSNGTAVYPSQVLTDLVNGEVVGLIAVYDKSVSTEELRDALGKLAGKSPLFQSSSGTGWRIESEQLAISVFNGLDGAKQVSYLKFGTLESHVPSAHLDCQKPEDARFGYPRNPFTIAAAALLIVLGWFLARLSGFMRRRRLEGDTSTA